MARRRASRWRKLQLWGLLGLATAFLGTVAFWVDWDPLPVLATLGGILLLVHVPGKSVSLVREYMMRDITDPLRYALTSYRVDDPLLWFNTMTDKLSSPSEDHDVRTAVGFDHLHNVFEEIRPLYIAIDGSERRVGFVGDFNPMHLPVWLRMMLLPDLCGLNINGVRRWKFYFAKASKPHYLTLKSGWEPGATIAFEPLGTAPELGRWLKAYPQIKALLGGDFKLIYYRDSGKVQLEWLDGKDGAGVFHEWISDSLLKFTDPIPKADTVAVAEETFDMLPYEPLPFIPAAQPAGHLARGWLYFGDQFLDRHAGGHWLKIEDLTHFLVMGTSGFGKSVFLNQVLQGVHYNLAHFDQVLLVDLKGGVELFPYQRLGRQFRVVYQLEDLPAVMSGLVATIRDRLERMRGQGVRMWPGPKTLLVIDEYAQIQLAPETSKEERQKKQELLADLNKISMLGRAAGVLIWAQLQKGTTDVMDSSFRANLASQVCFKVPNKLTAAGMFGSTDELLVDPVKLPKGRFVLFDAGKGETYYLQARVVRQ